MEEGESVKGACLLDTHCILYGHTQWILLTMQGTVLERHKEKFKANPQFQLLTMDFRAHGDYHVIFWTGDLDDKRLALQSIQVGQRTSFIQMHSALVMNRKRDLIYTCADPNLNNVSLFKLTSNFMNNFKFE